MLVCFKIDWAQKTTFAQYIPLLLCTFQKPGGATKLRAELSLGPAIQKQERRSGVTAL